jgi:hypothetical protein
MKTNSFTPMGSMHPVLFFVFIYVVALIVSIFICSSLFYSCNASSTPELGQEGSLKIEQASQQQAVTLRQ